MVNHKPLPPTQYFTILAMVSPIALNILLPSLPDVSVSLGVSTSEVQLSLTLYLLALAFGQLICGPISDRYGRRPVLIAGIAIHFFGCILGAISESLEELLVARVLQALGGCTGMVLARTIMLDCYSREKAAGKIGYITLAIALSQAIAPTLGGHINLHFGWQYLFHFSLILSSVSWLIALFMIPETIKIQSQSLKLPLVLEQYWRVLNAPGYLAYTLSTTFIASAFYLFIGSMPYIVNDEIGGNSADFGNWFAVVSIGFMCGSFLAARVSVRIGIERMIRYGHSISAFSSLLMLLLTFNYSVQYLTLFIPMALLTFGRGLSQPNNQAAAISSGNVSPGTASGLMGFIQLLTGAFITQLTPMLLSYGTIWILLSIFTCTVLAFVAHFANSNTS